MDRDEIIVEVSRRNAVSVTDALRRMALRIEEQQQRIDALNNAFASLHARFEALNTIMVAKRVATMGTGPTER